MDFYVSQLLKVVRQDENQNYVYTPFEGKVVRMNNDAVAVLNNIVTNAPTENNNINDYQKYQDIFYRLNFIFPKDSQYQLHTHRINSNRLKVLNFLSKDNSLCPVKNSLVDFFISKYGYKSKVDYHEDDVDLNGFDVIILDTASEYFNRIFIKNEIANKEKNIILCCRSIDVLKNKDVIYKNNGNLIINYVFSQDLDIRNLCNRDNDCFTFIVDEESLLELSKLDFAIFSDFSIRNIHLDIKASALYNDLLFEVLLNFINSKNSQRNNFTLTGWPFCYLENKRSDDSGCIKCALSALNLDLDKIKFTRYELDMELNRYMKNEKLVEILNQIICRLLPLGVIRF